MNIFKHVRMKFFIITGLLLLFINFHGICAAMDLEDAKRGIVKITVYKPIDWIDTGAGIILSIRDKRVYILTAYHLIENYKQIEVDFYRKLNLKLQGKFLMSDKDNDIAVICVDDIEDRDIGVSFVLGKVSKARAQDKIYIIGHPIFYEWEVFNGEIHSIDSSMIKFTAKIIEPGNSGGALLNQKLQLIGIVIKEEYRYGLALKIDIAFEIIKSWKIIPIDIKHPNIMRERKWRLIGGGIAIGAGIFGYCSIRKGKNKVDADLPTPPGMPH